MNLAIAKPDYRIAGGCEGVLDRLADGLRGAGHDVAYVHVDATGDPAARLPVAVPEPIWRQFPEFFNHAGLALAFEDLDLSSFDAVLSTQPPSYAVRHPRHLNLFFHHLKVCYDLEGVAARCGQYPPDLLRLGAEIVREIDRAYLTPDLQILANSERTRWRLRQFNGLEANVAVLYAGLDDDYLGYSGPIAYEDALCVGRHEFPKRPELFVHAMKHVSGLRGRVVGAGGRSEALRRIDVLLTHDHASGGPEPDDADLWQRLCFEADDLDVTGLERALAARGLDSNIAFTGRLGRAALVREFANAACVVCPAYEEDFGLTCIEAFAFGKPVVACVDGGGYAELIADGVDGFLVEPTGKAIAEAVSRFADRGLAREMGLRGREKARTFTWDRAVSQLSSKLAEVCA
ncbi:MAG: glycosyltransferase family 4 protein [Candidatus Sericytochromatia bacterium]|nr:glycosyltransferase family 4 protein [Candidatus Tanganyikabacteria bacterium]